MLLGRFLVQLGYFGTARRKPVSRLCEQENSKTCCRIYVGSPPQTTIINTRHTPPTNNQHTINNHNRHYSQPPPQPPTTKQASQPRRATEFASRACVLAPCACAWVRPLAAFRATSTGQQVNRSTGQQFARCKHSHLQTFASSATSNGTQCQPATANTDSAPVTVMR